MKVLIKGGNAVLPNRICENFNILIQDGKIKKTGNVDECADKVIDVGGMYVCPGFVDIHTHGGGGGDFMDATAESFEKALGFHAKNGTTALLATSVTAPLGQIFDMLCTARKFYGRKNPENSRVLGVHTEGPYLSVKNRGAQKKEYLRIPSENSYDFILKNADIIKSVTISPELNGAEAMANELKKCGITVCGGHDDGDRERILPVIKAGMSHCTHLWCAMSEVQMVNGRRSAGLCEIGLSDERLTAEIIADNYHITPEMAKIVYKCKGADKMCVVSDCLRAGGMKAGDTLYSLGTDRDAETQKFIVSDEVARLADGSRYAGSIQPISAMVKNLIDDCGIPLTDAIKSASLTPARIIGEDGRFGSIEEGKYGDFCIMNKKYEPEMTVIGGNVVYKRED